MIREQDVREAIAEMQGQRNPTAQTCIKLAAYYTILDHLIEKPVTDRSMEYSGAADSGEDFEYIGNSEFAQAIRGKDPNEVISLMDELMTTLQVVYPRLYDGVMSKL